MVHDQSKAVYNILFAILVNNGGVINLEVFHLIVPIEDLSAGILI